MVADYSLHLTEKVLPIARQVRIEKTCHSKLPLANNTPVKSRRRIIEAPAQYLRERKDMKVGLK
jgi:hypothetical protein